MGRTRRTTAGLAGSSGPPAELPLAAPPGESLLAPVDLLAWRGFLEVHTLLLRRLDADLVASHGMPLVEYEVLFKIFLAGGRSRMSDLAEVAMLSRSGLTRIVDVLVAQRLVRRLADQDDGRVVLATLTPAGRRRLQSARRSHSAHVRRLFLDPLSPAQKETLGAAWLAVQDRLAGRGGGPPAAGDDDGVAVV